MSSQETPIAIRTLFDAFNANDLDRAASVVTSDFELVDVATGMTFHGPAGLRLWLEPWLRAAPDAKTEITNVIVAGALVATEHIGRGTHTGPLQSPAGDVPPTGRSFELRIAEVYELRDGKIDSLRAYYDIATFLRQLGLMP